jgi:mRNA-degrading endonuclease RelE of RelBE toxin-antitoxin system
LSEIKFEERHFLEIRKLPEKKRKEIVLKVKTNCERFREISFAETL